MPIQIIQELALLSGIDPDKVVHSDLAISGCSNNNSWRTCMGLDKGFAPRNSTIYCLLPIFASVIVGGIGSPLGAIAGCFFGLIF